MLSSSIWVAGEMVADEKEAEAIGITGRERAFYDALIRDRSAEELLADETLKLIAIELLYLYWLKPIKI